MNPALRQSENPATETGTPAMSGFCMPAEWEPHDATWIAWPHNRTDWPGKFQAIPWVYADIVRHLAAVERVELLVNDARAEANVRRILQRSAINLDNVRFHHIPTNRGWTRDYGPIFVRKAGAVGVTKWQFNAWAKYPDWQLDEAAGEAIAGALNLPCWQPTIGGRRIVLEGGSIDVNGAGALLTTEECLLGDIQQRNPGFTREQLEHVFADYLGVRKVIWLGRGIVGDDTHGHIDDIARFVAPDTVAACVEPNAADPNQQPLQDNLERLRAASDQDGRPLRIVELPMPAPVTFRDQRLPASYANFYIANHLVLVPTFNDPNDRVALDILADLFPTRTVTGIHARDLVWGLGTLHCLTQQQPRPG